MASEKSRAESWLRREVGNAPRPLPKGRFPLILQLAETSGFSHDTLLDALDEWLHFGYCRITEQISQDIEVMPEGHAYFYRR